MTQLSPAVVDRKTRPESSPILAAMNRVPVVPPRPIDSLIHSAAGPQGSAVKNPPLMPCRGTQVAPPSTDR